MQAPFWGKFFRNSWQGDFGKNKKEEIPQSNPKKDKDDKEIEVLMKEYETLRAEIGFRYGMQTQFTNIAFLLIGGFVAAAPLLVSSDLHLKVPPLYFVVLLLIISLLFTSLLWASLLQLLEFRNIGTYTVQFIRKRVLDILEKCTEEDARPILSWDSYHAHVSSPFSPKNRSDKLVMLLLTLSPYAVMAIPALLTLAPAIWFYLTNSSILPTNPGEWIATILIIFDIFYLSMGILSGLRVMGVFKEIQVNWPPQE